jgi:hypothetical protein
MTSNSDSASREDCMRFVRTVIVSWQSTNDLGALWMCCSRGPLWSACRSPSPGSEACRLPLEFLRFLSILRGNQSVRAGCSP